MKESRHLYAPPVIDAKAIARDILAKAPVGFRAPHLVPVEYVKNGEALELYQLVEDYSSVIRGVRYTEKKGRLVDGASVPRLAWWWAPPDGRHRRAAFWHDVFYATGLLPKAIADEIFYELLLADRVTKSRAWIMYQAVKRFGNPKNSVSRWSKPLYPEET